MFEAFKIGVKISLINHAALGLAALAKDFMRTEAQAAALQKRIDSINKQAMKGGLMLGLGGAMAGMLKGPYEEAKKLEQERQKFQALNLSAQDNALAYATAQQLAHKNLGSTIGENIALIRDLHTAFGDLPHAIGMAEDFQKFSIMSRVQNDGKPVEGLVYNAVKALEHRGDRLTQHPDEMRSELARMSQVYTGSGGKVSPSDYFHASQTGKMAYTMYDKDFLYGPFAAYMQAKTGPTAGTAGMTMFSSLVGGHMDNKAKGFLASLGLLQIGVSKDQVKLINDSINKLDLPEAEKKKLRKAEMPLTGGVKADFVDMVAHRPDKFAQEVLAPAIRKQFGLDLTNEQVAEIIASKFNRNTADFLGEFIVNSGKFSKDAKIFANAKDYRNGYQQYMQSPEGAELAAEGAFKNFLAVFGTVYLPTITSGLLKLAGALDSLGQWVERNPGPVKLLTHALIGLSGALMIRGTVLVLTAAMRGLGLALAMQAVGGAAGLARIVGLIGGVGKSALFGAIGSLAGPIGLVSASIGSLLAALGPLLLLFHSKDLNEGEGDYLKKRQAAAGGVDPSTFDFNGPANRGGSPHIATGGGQTNVTVHATMDGTPIHTKVVQSIVRKTSTALGSGFYDLNASAPTQLAPGH